MTAPEIDAADWLGLQPTHNPMRWSLPITPAISVRSRFLFGGAAHSLVGEQGRQCTELPDAAARRAIVTLAARAAGVRPHLNLSHPRVLSYVHDGPEQATKLARRIKYEERIGRGPKRRCEIVVAPAFFES